jgi:CubicO group peptidase (beta-lactamase class C family)
VPFPRLRFAALALMLASTGCSVHYREPVVFASGHARFPNAVEARIHRIEARASIPARLAQYRVPGVSVAVVNNGVVEWARGYGVQEAGGSDPVTQDTVFQAASVSKPVSAMAALRLVQDQRAALDEDVNRRLTSWKLPESAHTRGRPVTLRALLSHSGGIGVHGFGGYASNARMPSVVDILDGRGGAHNGPIRCEATPGQRSTYSGGGYLIAQQLVSDVAGQPFADVMENLVLRPLGMTHSTFDQPLPEAYWGHAASGHASDGTELAGRWHNYPELAAAGLWTTPTDLARVIVEIQNAVTGRQSQVLGQAITAQMLTHQLPTGNAGLGFFVTGRGNATQFSHSGVNAGFRSVLIGAAYTGQGVVVMSNSDSGGKLNDEIARIVEAEYGWGKPGRDDDAIGWLDESDESDDGAEPADAPALLSLR